MRPDCSDSIGDPLIDEVRQRRRDLLAAYDNDLDKLFAAIQELQAQHPEKLVDRRPHTRGAAQALGADEAAG